MRLAEIVSAPLGIEPVTGLSFSSNCTEKPYAMGVPSAATPAKVYFTPSPCASTVRVKLLGAGPGSYFDFVRFSFQVPTSGLLCARTAEELATANSVITANCKARFMCDPPGVRSSVVEVVDLTSIWKFLGSTDRGKLPPRQ